MLLSECETHDLCTVLISSIYIYRSFQLLAVILDQIKPLGRRTTLEIAYHSDGPVQKDYYIQLPVDTEAEAVNPPMSIAA